MEGFSLSAAEGSRDFSDSGTLQLSATGCIFDSVKLAVAFSSLGGLTEDLPSFGDDLSAAAASVWLAFGGVLTASADFGLSPTGCLTDGGVFASSLGGGDFSFRGDFAGWDWAYTFFFQHKSYLKFKVPINRISVCTEGS